MAKIKLPYIAWREGRPRFVPGPRERAIGFAPVELKHADGRWFDLREAKLWADAKRTEIATARKGGRKARGTPPAPRGRTVEDLLEAFLKSGRFTRPRADGGYAERTAADYREKADCIIFKPRDRAQVNTTMRKPAAPEREREAFALAPAAEVTPRNISNDDEGGFFEYLCRARGRRTARNCIMVLSAAYKWARKAKGWELQRNPCAGLGLRGPQLGDAVTWEVEEFNAFVRCADHPKVGEHELADAVVLALYTAQRPADVLAYDGGGTSEGVTRLVQSKRGKRVEIPQLPPLVARLAAMQARREAKGYACAELVVDSHTGRGFNQSTFEKRFRALRGRVAAGDETLELPACPSIAGKDFRHLRKTMLTWLKRAGVADHLFAAVSGHSLQSLPQVMPHYYTPGSGEAAEAMARVWTWLQARGMAG